MLFALRASLKSFILAALIQPDIPAFKLCSPLNLPLRYSTFSEPQSAARLDGLKKKNTKKTINA